MAQKKGCGTSPKRECRNTDEAIHEEHFLSGWLGKHVEGKAEEVEKTSREAKEEESKSGM